MLTILSRRNQSYIRFRAEEKSMEDMHELIAVSLGSDRFGDQAYVPAFDNYTAWRDLYFSVTDLKKGIEVEFVCGYEVIHLFVRKCDDWDWFNAVLDKHAKWAMPKKK